MVKIAVVVGSTRPTPQQANCKSQTSALVALPFATDFENFTTFTPSQAAEEALVPLLDQLISWSTALKTIRT